MSKTTRVTAVVALALAVAMPLAHAQSAPTAAPKPATKAAAKPVNKAASRKPAKTPEQAPPSAADALQIEASERVYYGVYDCEFKQSVNIVPSPKFPAYVDVQHGKSDYLMKPVVSSTGAVRLEDVRGETLMVQISSKSMLLNVVTGHRIVDECISPRQRELTEIARAEKAAQTASVLPEPK